MQVIDRLKEAYPISQLCDLGGVSRSSYYAYRNQVAAPESSLVPVVRRLHAASRRSLGSRRMAAALRNEGHAVGRYRARSLMRQAAVAVAPRHRSPRRVPPASGVIAPNVLARQFNPQRPNQVWAGDITYLHTAQGWLYLAIVVDLYSRRVIGWAFSACADTDLVLRASQMALAQRRPHVPVLFHSDQGCQYTSLAFAQHLQQHGIRQSLSRRGNCWDNAVVERVFRSMKYEWIGRQIYATHAQAIHDVTEYILRFYNHRRPHTTTRGLPPAVFEASAAIRS